MNLFNDRVYLAGAALSLGLILVSPLVRAQDEFKANNPDIKKYEFARSYITALSYLTHINERWKTQAPKTLYTDDERIIKASISYLIKDNADLRVTKNYMVPYLKAPNALMRKVADTLILACGQEIAINDKDKVLWQQWDLMKKAGKGTAANEKEFIKAHAQLVSDLKEADKQIIEATIMMTKVLISDKNPDGKGHYLAVSDDQREKLLDILDRFGRYVLDWGLKPGQSPLEASIAVVREILEDSIWIPTDEQ